MIQTGFFQLIGKVKDLIINTKNYIEISYRKYRRKGWQ